jgi:hypothetical protein
VTAATCPRCGRPEGDEIDPSNHAACSGGYYCDAYAAGYRAGIAHGVALAKEHAEIERYTFRIVPTIDWSAVDAAAKGE